jgi:hypothetical protein
LEETETSLTSTTEEITKTDKEIVEEEGAQTEEKKELEKVTRRKLR